MSKNWCMYDHKTSRHVKNIYHHDINDSYLDMYLFLYKISKWINVCFFRLIAMLWYISSIMVNVKWKQLIHKEKPYVLHLTVIQFTFATLISCLLILLCKPHQETIIRQSSKQGKGYIVIGVAFAIGQVCTNTALSIVSVTLTHVIKITEPIIVMLLGISFLKYNISKTSLACICFIQRGIILINTSDETLQFKGVLFAFLSNIAFPVRNLFIVKHQQHNKTRKLYIFFISCVTGLGLLSILTLAHNAYMLGEYLVTFCFHNYPLHDYTQSSGK